MNLDRDLIPPPFEMSEKRSLRIHFYVNHVHEVGTYFRFHNLAIGLTKLGHQVTVYAADQNFKTHRRLETRDNVAYFIEPENYLVRMFGNACDPITCFKRRFQKTPQCDVAHLFQPFPSAASAWFRSNAMVRFYDWDDLWSGGLMSGPISRMSDRWSRFVVGFLEARLLRWTNHVTGISQYLVDRARQHGAKNVTLVNSGSWPSEIVESRETLRSKLGLQNDGLYAGFMGRTTAELS